MKSTEKTRNLSPYQFFQILQVEWIVADLRTRIYPKGKNRDYWEKVKEGKEIKFTQIADKNTLPTILTDEEMRRSLESKVYNEKGLPNFLYKDEAQRDAQEPLDLAYYYNKGTEVRFMYLADQKIGIVKSYLPYKDPIIVIAEEQEYTVNVKEVTRIL